MFAAADIGNSRIKFAIFNDTDLNKENNDNPIFYTVAEHNRNSLIQALTKILKYSKNIKTLYYSSVAVRSENMFLDTVDAVLKTEAKKITYKDIPFKKINYTKETIGTDRLLSSFAACSILNKKYNDSKKFAAVTIDMGSATTVNVIKSDFEFLGGIIMSGMLTSYNSLIEKTSLPVVEVNNIKKMPSAICENTEDALISGIFFHTVGAVKLAIEDISTKIKKEHNIETIPIITGGLSHLLMLPYETYPYLVLQGIYYSLKTKIN